jgi:hypothetical protein
VNTKICVKSCFFALFSRTKNFFKKKLRRKQENQKICRINIEVRNGLTMLERMQTGNAD